MKQAPIQINRKQRLYVIPCHGRGFSCLGFDVCEDWTRKFIRYLGWISEITLPHRKGTKRAYAYYKRAEKLAYRQYRETGRRCTEFLRPELIPHERCRVEVVYRYGESLQTERFYVGKSTGWAPIHLQVARMDSSGGGGIAGDIISVRRIGEKRI